VDNRSREVVHKKLIPFAKYFLKKCVLLRNNLCVDIRTISGHKAAITSLDFLKVGVVSGGTLYCGGVACVVKDISGHFKICILF